MDKSVQSTDTAEGSVGIVTPTTYTFDTPLTLACGRVLPHYQLIVETYGTLNSSASNAILICHALSGSHHAAGYYAHQDRSTAKPGWWDACIGPGKAIDTNNFYVVSLNNIGGCNGSTGPTSPHPTRDGVYGADFPLVTVKDWVHTQCILADRLGINTWHAVVGGSLGGMQAMRWAIDYPQRLRKCVIIACAPKLTAQNIAFNEVARQSILSDPHFCNGDYIAQGVSPSHGLSVARMVGHITYLSENAMNAKFARALKTQQLNYGYDVDFQVESYLRYQGAQFSKSFDANTYMIMTKALDYFDPAGEYNDNLAQAFAHTSCQFLVVSFTTDWRFAPSRSSEIVNAMIATNKPVSYINVEASQGHDAFLFPIPRYVKALRQFLSPQGERPNAE